MLLFIAVLFIAAAAFALSEAATYPARLKARSIRLAADYGRVRVPTRVDENLRFRERVVMPASARLASIPLKLNPRTNIDAIGARLQAAGLAQRITPSSFLAIKGGTMVGAVLLGLLLAALLSFASGIILLPVLGAIGFIGPDFILSSRIRKRRELVRGALPDALDLLAVSVEAGPRFRRRGDEADRAHGRPARRGVRPDALGDPHGRVAADRAQEHGDSRWGA